MKYLLLALFTSIITSMSAHDILEFKDVSTTYILVDKANSDTLTVTWKPVQECADRTDKKLAKYTVEITRINSGLARYSLWTLGFQNAKVQKADITSVPGTVKFADSEAGPYTSRTAPVAMVLTGTRKDPSDPTKQIVDDKKIMMIELTSGKSFKFEVECKRRHFLGYTVWSDLQCASGGGHDNTPPGSTNGE